MGTRRKFSDQFRADAVSLVLDQNYSQTDAAESLGIGAGMLGRWIREHKKGTAITSTPLASAPAELIIFKKKYRRLEQDFAILKKALPIFIRQPE